LPKLPVPKLADTLAVYLKVIKPITTESQYEHASHLVKEFQAKGGEGEKLQKLIEDLSETTDNWVCGCTRTSIKTWFNVQFSK